MHVCVCVSVCLCVCVCVCVAPTSEALTRPSWKEQLDGSWVHRLRYLHQWQRKALFTHDRHLHGHAYERGAVKEGRRGTESRGQAGAC